jgi:DNA-binding transcriptional LysR family regulator
MIEVRRLRLLRELAARGTVAAAARACHLTPSAVSQQLAVLEREAGVPLVERAGRTLRLTEAARRLVAHTEVILADLERAQADLAALPGSVRGTVHLAAFPTAMRALVPAAIGRCEREHPELRVVLHQLEPQQSLPALKLGDLDVAVCYEYDLLPRQADPGLELAPLLVDPMQVALPRGHPATAERVALSRLRDDRWIAAADGTACHAHIVRACALAGFTPRIEAYSDDFTAILAMVEAGLGVSLLPELATSTQRTQAELRPVADMPLSRRLLAAVRAGSAQHPALAAVVNALTTTASAMHSPPAAPTPSIHRRIAGVAYPGANPVPAT